jgi:hypothetical protein
VIRGDGQGESRIGETLELPETLRSLLFASLIRQEYIDAVDKNDESFTATEAERPTIGENFAPGQNEMPLNDSKRELVSNQDMGKILPDS